MAGHLPTLKQKKSRTRTQCVGTITSHTRKPELNRAGRSTARLPRSDTFPLCLNRRLFLHACRSPRTAPHVMLTKAHGAGCREFQQKIAMSNSNCRAVRHDRHRGGSNVCHACYVGGGELLFHLNIKMVIFFK